jgi:large subunit ribosomal protein L20
MSRIKRGKTANKRRKNILKHAKGFRWGRKAKYRLAKEALQHAWEYAYRDRKINKRNFRQFWQSRISEACKQTGLPYNKFIYGLKKNKIGLDRKILCTLTQEYPEIFKKVIEKAKN